VANRGATQAESGVTHSQSGECSHALMNVCSLLFLVILLIILLVAENLSQRSDIRLNHFLNNLNRGVSASTSSYRRRSELVGEQSCSKKRASFQQTFLSVRTADHRRACKKFKVDSRVRKDPKSTVV
jgi:hypothetical protein